MNALNTASTARAAREAQIANAPKYVTEVGWSDRNPWEVIRATACTLTVRRMAWTHAEGAAPYSQDWVITPDPDGETRVLRLSREFPRAVTYLRYGTRYIATEQPEKHHDHGF